MNVSNFYFNLQQTLKLNLVNRQAIINTGLSNLPCSRVLKSSALHILKHWITLESPEDSVYAVLECLRGVYSAIRIQTDLPDHKHRRN
jgi:hypothetical protein